MGNKSSGLNTVDPVYSSILMFGTAPAMLRGITEHTMHTHTDRTHEILLRRRSSVLVQAGVHKASRHQLDTVQSNLARLGYTASETLVQRLCTLDAAALNGFVNRTIELMRTALGDNRNFRTMYPNFPTQVREASASELFVNASLHYLGDALGVRIMPDYLVKARPALTGASVLKTVELAEPDDLRTLARQLIGSKTSISETDKDDVRWLVGAYSHELDQILPARWAHRENMAVVAAQLVNLGHADSISAWCTSATDVLRLAVALSDGDVSLASNTRFRSFGRAQRRMLLSSLDAVAQPLEDMFRHRQRWIRLGERLHPSEYRRRYAHAAKAFDAVRADQRPTTFASQVEALILARDIDDAARLLASRPGELARRLDHLLRLSDDHEVILGTFAEVVQRVSTPVLLQLCAHFAHRQQGRDQRVVFPKGLVAKAFVVPGALPPIAPTTCDVVVDIARYGLISRFAERSPLGQVYVDPDLQNYMVPFSQRSANKALRTLVRGSRVPMPDADTLRFFLWWREGTTAAGEATGRVDIDLSAVFYDDSWDQIERISYTNLRSSFVNSVHSGDITSAPDGACEFIDVHVPSARKARVRFVIMTVMAYSSHSLCDLPECFAGWMPRAEPNSGEIFEPATVLDKIDLASNTRISIPMVFDLEERTMIWSDLALKAMPTHVNVESNHSGLATMGAAMAQLIKPDLCELLRLHAVARGALVDRPEDADTVFSVRTGTPFDVQTLMADYL